MRFGLFLGCLFLATTPLAETITGKVVAIADGDTLTLLVHGKEQVKIRLAEIDTPEKRQPYGNKARQALAALALKKDASVMWSKRDRYRRVVGRTFVDGLNVNNRNIIINYGTRKILHIAVKVDSTFDRQHS